MATETLLELQKRLTVALALDEEGRTRRAGAFARKVTAAATFKADDPKARDTWQKRAAANAAAFASHEETNKAAQESWFAMMGVSETHDRIVNLANAELRETAPAQYSAFLDVLDRWFDECRHSSHGKSGVARMKAVQAARTRIEELQLLPDEDAKADAHVEKLRRSIPALDE
jgi:hypothetical protein